VFASVWDVLEDSPEEAVNMRLRSELMIAIRIPDDQTGFQTM
jgi:predicted XRE-type DNA-binding protein